MMAVDLQTILICLAVFIISAFLIYLILVVTMRETTFEQVMEEQKRNQEAAQYNRQKEPKKEKKKKFKKGKGGDKAAAEVEKKDDVFSERKMVELEIDPECIEVSDSGSTSTPPAKKSKAAKGKPILANKEEKGVIGKDAPELFHRKNVPKDAVELKHEREQHQARNGKEEVAAVRVQETAKAAGEVRKPVEVPRVAEPTSLAEAQKLSSAAQPAVSKKEASKKKKAPRDVSEEPVAEVVEKVVSTKLGSAPPTAELVNGCEPPLKSTKKNKNYDLTETGRLSVCFRSIRDD